MYILAVSFLAYAIDPLYKYGVPVESKSISGGGLDVHHNRTRKEHASVSNKTTSTGCTSTWHV